MIYAITYTLLVVLTLVSYFTRLLGNKYKTLYVIDSDFGITDRIL